LKKRATIGNSPTPACASSAPPRAGAATAGLVRAFYQDALPALGWALSVGSGGENETVYLRGREQLELSIHQRGEDVLLEVRVFVNPAPRD
jgi:hypothetical protein